MMDIARAVGYSWLFQNLDANLKLPMIGAVLVPRAFAVPV
jgi:hypothetical protein